MVINTLDLFSGIGGFALGLRDVARTVAYCEIDERCRVVLANNMSKGHLHKGPVFEDVTKLQPEHLSRFNVRMITAGSPCQDISVANRGATGINGKRSRLIFEVVRLMECMPSIQYVLFENSPAIVTRGLDVLTRRLQSAQWDLAWTVVDAREIGCLHSRRRWFALAVRRGASPPSGLVGQKNVQLVPIRKSPPRVVRSNPTAYLRNRMLGNSVIPAVAMYALGTLAKHLDATMRIGIDPGPACVPRCKLTSLINGHVHQTWRRCAPAIHRSLSLIFRQGATNLHSKWWATPTSVNWSRLRTLTPKVASLHLSVQILFEEETRQYMQSVLHTGEFRDVSINPRFVEWLMHFPSDWTATIRG